MEELLKALSGLITVCAANLPAACILLLMIAILIILGAFYKHGKEILLAIEKVSKHTPEAEHAMFSAALEAEQNINTLLDEELHYLNGARIGIWRWTNGSYDLTSLPFFNARLVFLKQRAGVSVSPTLMTFPTPLSAMSDVTKDMFRDPKNPTPTTTITSEVTNPVWRAILDENGVAISFHAPISNLKGQPLGVIGIAYMDIDAHRPSESVILTRLQASATRVAGFLVATGDISNK